MLARFSQAEVLLGGRPHCGLCRLCLRPCQFLSWKVWLEAAVTSGVQVTRPGQPGRTPAG